MATIKGKWLFDKYIAYTSYITFVENVTFTSNGKTFNSINSTYSESSEKYYIYYDTTKIYDGIKTAWTNEAYRTVDFGKTDQTVSDTFYNWLTANATQQTAPEPVIPTGEATITLNNKNFSIDYASITGAFETLNSHLLNIMNGTGAFIDFSGVTFSVDSTKLNQARNEILNYLETISGSGSTITVDGVEYGVDSSKVSGAISKLEATLDDLESGGESGISNFVLSDGNYYETSDGQLFEVVEEAVFNLTIHGSVSGPGGEHNTYIKINSKPTSSSDYDYDAKTLYLSAGGAGGTITVKASSYWCWDTSVGETYATATEVVLTEDTRVVISYAYDGGTND